MTENGIRFLVDVIHGQKTGFFLDQKENRREVMRLCGGARVLDCFTHNGSFALHAAKAGAASVLGVDISEEAVEVHEATDRYLPQILGELLESETLKTLPPARILNVNFPGCPIGECRGIMRDVTVSDGRVFRDHYVLQKTLRDGGMRLAVEGKPDMRAEEGTDLWAVTHGYVSVGIARNIS